MLLPLGMVWWSHLWFCQVANPRWFDFVMAMRGVSKIGAVKILALPKWLDQIGHQVYQQKDAPGTS